MGIETLTFYTGLPRFGEFMDEQWGMFRTDFDTLGPLARAAYADLNSDSGEHDLAGLAIGELDFRNRYRVFYDKVELEYRIQFNKGTEDAPNWDTYVKIRDEDGRFIVSSTGGLESSAGFYNFDYLQVTTHGIDGGYSKNMVNRFALNALDGFYWSNDSTGGPVVNLEPVAGSGEANTASNLAGDEGLFTVKAGVDLPFKSLSEGANITLSSDANTITITAAGGGGNGGTGFYGMNVGHHDDNPMFKGINTIKFHADEFYVTQNSPNTDEVVVNSKPPAGGGGSGEINTGTSLAGDADVFKQKSGVQLQFRGLSEGSNITLTENANDITIASSGGGGAVAVEETNFYYKDGAPFTDASADTLIFDHNFYLSANQAGATLVSLKQNDAGDWHRPKWAGCTKFGSTTSATNITWEHTVWPGPNRGLFLCLTKMHDSAERVPNRVTYAGINMRLIHVAGIEGSGTTDPMGFVYCMTGAPVGVHPIVVDWGAATGAYACIAANYIHVNQSHPVATAISDTNNTGSTIADVAPLTGMWWKSDRSTLFTVVGAGHAASKTYTPNSPAGMEQRAYLNSGATATTEVEMIVGDVPLPTAYVDSTSETQWTISASEENYITAIEIAPACSGALSGDRYQGRLIMPEPMGTTDATAGTDNAPWPMITWAQDQRSGLSSFGTNNLSFIMGGNLVMDLTNTLLDGTTHTTDLDAQFATFNAGNGSAGNCSFQASADANSGMFFPAADKVGIAAGGREMVRATNSTTDWVSVSGNAQAGFRGLKIMKAAHDVSWEPSDTHLLHIVAGGASVEGHIHSFGQNSKVTADGFYLNEGGELAALDDPTDGDMLLWENGAYREARLDPGDFYTSTGGDGRLIISIR